MKKKPVVCKKKPMTLKQVKGFLAALKRGGYSKNPRRDEVSYYKCEICGQYHTSKKLGTDSTSLIKDKTYFEFQQEKWRGFLQNFSNKKGRL